VPRQLVHLDERALVEELGDPLAGGHLALGVLLLDGAGRGGVDRLVEPAAELGDLALGRVQVVVGLDVVLGELAVGRVGRRGGLRLGGHVGHSSARDGRRSRC
jgi:hypothetical protein